MQIRPNVYSCASFDPMFNVFCGAWVLWIAKETKQKDWSDAWFVAYNYGIYSKIKHPEKTKYFEKVMGAM